MNSGAIDILEKNQDKISWPSLSQNPGAIRLIENNLDKISWYWLSRNPCALHILEKNQDKLDKVCWAELSRNPSSFCYDYKAMKQTRCGLNEEIAKIMFHPKNMSKFEGWGIDCGYEEEE